MNVMFSYYFNPDNAIKLTIRQHTTKHEKREV